MNELIQKLNSFYKILCQEGFEIKNTKETTIFDIYAENANYKVSYDKTLGQLIVENKKSNSKQVQTVYNPHTGQYFLQNIDAAVQTIR